MGKGMTDGMVIILIKIRS